MQLDAGVQRSKATTVAKTGKTIRIKKKKESSEITTPTTTDILKEMETINSNNKVDDVLSEASKISDHYFGVTTDVLDEEGLNYGFERVIEKFGKVDSLINGAGGNMPNFSITLSNP